MAVARLVVDRWLVERRPAPDLADRLVCVWRGDLGSAELPLPDERLDLVWVDDGSLWLAGPETTSWSRGYPPGTTAVGVGFKPGVGPPTLGLAGSEVRDARVRLDELWGDVGACLALPRAALHQVLRAGVAVRMGHTIGSLDRLDGPVGVRFDDGRQDEFDLVVGADGLRSVVRRLAVDPQPPVPVGQHSWRFLTACPPEVTTWTVMLGRGASFLTIPVGGGQVYCYADVTADGVPAGDPLAVLRERFAGFVAPVPQLLKQLHDPAQVHVAAIEQVAAERWGRGAVVLIGDAAHGMSPNMAQGAALAFEDGLVLAASLRDAGSVAGALSEFVDRRHPRAGWVRAQTHRRDRTRNLPPILRDQLLRTFGRRIFRSNYHPLVTNP